MVSSHIHVPRFCHTTRSSAVSGCDTIAQVAPRCVHDRYGLLITEKTNNTRKEQRQQSRSVDSLSQCADDGREKLNEWPMNPTVDKV